MISRLLGLVVLTFLAVQQFTQEFFGQDRVIRGGSFDYGAVVVRAAYRYYHHPSDDIEERGFRLARSAR